MLTLQQIIEQADKLVPNSESNADKVMWLNEVNNRFFEVVKIPQTETFTTAAGTATYSGLSAAIRSRNIDKVFIGKAVYPSFLHEDVPPGHNYHIFNDDGSITIHPTPTQSGLTGIIRWHRIATSTYTTGNLNAMPDAPGEYHYVYVFGLASKIAQALEDIVKHNNYEKSFVDNLLIAQQNFASKG